jgi:GT2 family glycosyltransferase
MQAQKYPDYEILVIDSSPDDRTEKIVSIQFPGVRYQHSQQRLLPHAARNRGVKMARGELFVFTDPDIYATPHWLAKLVQAYIQYGGVISGALACYGQKQVDKGIHICKFDQWLPGGSVRKVSVAASANMLCERETFESVGGFDDNCMIGDTMLSWKLTRAGVPIWFVPEAVVEHHHTGTWKGLLQERYFRGREYGQMRLTNKGWGRGRVLLQAIASIFPIRLTKLILRGATNAFRAGCLADFLSISPIVISGQAAWLAGEAKAYLRLLKG